MMVLTSNMGTSTLFVSGMIALALAVSVAALRRTRFARFIGDIEDLSEEGQG